MKKEIKNQKCTTSIFLVNHIFRSYSSIMFKCSIFLKNGPRLLLLLKQKRSNLLKVTVVLTPFTKNISTYWQGLKYAFQDILTINPSTCPTPTHLWFSSLEPGGGDALLAAAHHPGAGQHQEAARTREWVDM